MVTMPATPSAMVKATSEGIDAGSGSTGQVTTYTVVNVRKRKAHCTTSTSKCSICNWFTCGTIDEPAAGAAFGDIGTAEKCTICFRDGMRSPGAGVYGAPATPKMVTMPATPSAMVKVTSEGNDASSGSTGQVTTYTVVNVRRRKAHCTTSTSRRSICNWFTCGTIDEPAAGAVFGDVGTAEKCVICFRDGMRRMMEPGF